MLHLRLFAKPELLDHAGAAIALWRPQVALLAYLSLGASRGATRAAIARLLWPDSAEDAARRALRQALFQLRRQCGPLVIADGETVCVAADQLRVDVREFELELDAGRLPDALEVYRGPLLAGFSLRGSPEFEHWADRERTRLAGRAASACARLADEALECGAWDNALRSIDQWLSIAPLSEGAWRRRILARARAGDRAAALEDFALFRRRLAVELELEPGLEICELVERVRCGGQVLPRSEPPLPRRSAPDQRELPLIGREREFAALSSCWHHARSGWPQLTVISGEPGIGKTRLAEELARVAALDGATVLRTRAYEVERGIPYGTLTGLLRCALDAPGLAGVDAAALGEISRIVPEVRRRFTTGVAAPSSDLQAGRIRLLEALVALVEGIAYEAPVLLLVDDLPWADDATVTALHYLWRRSGSLPLLLLGTARDEDLIDGLAARLLTSAARETPQQLHRLQLGPLEGGAIARLIAAATDEVPVAAEHVDSLERNTGGNPLYLLEMLSAKREGKADFTAGDNLSGLIADRLERLPPLAHQLLRGAAVIGRRFPLPLAASVAGLSAMDGLSGVEELLRRRLVQQVQYGYDFTHDVVREAVYSGMSAERRRALHEQAFARLLPDEAGGPVGLELASGLALHASRAELRRDALRWFLEAAEHARRLFAGAEAEAFLARAAEAAQTAEEQRQVWERRGDLDRARCLFARSATAFLQARTWTAAASDDRLRLRIKILDALLRCDGLAGEALQPTIEPLLSDAAAAGGRLYRDALMAAADACLRTGNLADARQHSATAVEVARPCDETDALVRALLLQARVLGSTGSPESVAELLEEAVASARVHDLHTERWDAESDLALELYRRGDWEGAQRLMRQVIEGATLGGALGAVAVAALNLGDLLLRQGRWDEAQQALLRAATLADAYDFPHVAASVRLNRALLAWHRGEPTEAAALAAAAADHAASGGFTFTAAVAVALRMLTLLDSGNLELADEDPLTGGWPTAEFMPGAADGEIVCLARARLLRARGETTAAERLLREALRSTHDVYATAVLKNELADLLTGSAPAEVSRLTAEAARIFAELGATPQLVRTRPAPEPGFPVE